MVLSKNIHILESKVLKQISFILFSLSYVYMAMFIYDIITPFNYYMVLGNLSFIFSTLYSLVMVFIYYKLRKNIKHTLNIK